MKNARTLMIAVVLLAAVSVCSNAEDRQLVTANIPFAFTADNANLPAGDYTVSVMAPFNLIKLQSKDGRSVAMIAALATPAAGTSGQSKLVFQRYGSHYILDQIWQEGSSVHRDLRRGEFARELAHKNELGKPAVILASAAAR